MALQVMIFCILMVFVLVALGIVSVLAEKIWDFLAYVIRRAF